MIIAKFNLDQKQFNASPTLQKLSKSNIIDVLKVNAIKNNLPLWASTAMDYIGCRHAWPHRDESYENEMFLTLCILGNHQICDDKCEKPYTLSRGDFMVIDPMTRHWLAPNLSHRGDRGDPFLGLQWIVPADEAKSIAQALIRHGEGVWMQPEQHDGLLHINQIDERYESWIEA